MTLNLVWSVGLAVIGIVGIWLAGRRNLWGWAIGLAAQVLWIVFALVTGQYGFIFSALAYGFVYARNWLRWRRDRDEHSAAAG
jgi:nicotinamide riboside transporter PnuC